MKKVINDPRNIVREMLEGAVSVSQGQALLENETVVVRKRPAADRQTRRRAHFRRRKRP